MNIKEQLITLNNREYTIQDMGEGNAFLLIKHQQIIPVGLLDLMVNHKQCNTRIITLDITPHFPPITNSLSAQQLATLIEDLHLLCDIYWLEEVEVHSYYYPDVVQQHMKSRLGKRVSDPLFTSFGGEE